MKKVQNKVQNKKYNKVRDKRIKKAGITALSVSVLLAGTAGIVYAYQSGKNYKPSKEERDLQDNQVVFSKDDNALGQDLKKKKEESELLNQNKKGDNLSGKEKKADYLFKNSSLLMSGNTMSVNLSSSNGFSDTSGNNSKGTTYNLTGNGSKADIFVDNGSGDGNSDGGDVPGDNNNNNNPGTNPGGDNPGGNNPGGNQNRPGDDNPGTKPGNDDSGNDDSGKKSDSIKDPESEKKNPGNDPYFTYKPYEDDIKPSRDPDEDGNTASVVITAGMDADSSMLYKGQSVTERIVYNALSTFVVGADGNIYLWGADSYNTYVKITGLSFDGGKTWNESFPITIPQDVTEGQMKIRAEYRLSKKSSKWLTRIVDYDPKDTRLFVLSKPLGKNEDTIDASTILNTGNQYPDIGSKENLYGEQSKYLDNNGNLTALFPGWMEDGKLVDWFYPVTSGRHILEPADMQSIDEAYIVKLTHIWMSEDYKVDSGDDDKLCYLQTLTDMNGVWRASWEDEGWQVHSIYHRLYVPKYIQAIRINENAGLSINYMSIPDTVVYIETQDCGMRVNAGYEVDPANPCYSSTADGLLMNKDQTEILSIPFNRDEIEIPATVKKVKIAKLNHLEKITLPGTTKEELPDISYSNLENCKVVVSDDLIETLLKENPEAFSKESGNQIVGASDPDTGYFVDAGMIVSTSGELIKVLAPGNRRTKLPESVKAVCKGAFEETQNVTSLVLPQNGNTVTFEKGSLSDSKVNLILCYGKKQYEETVKQISEAGLTDITVEMLMTSREGYGYSISYEQGKEHYTLIDAPEDVKEFDGKVTAEDGSEVPITEIADAAFQSSTNLEWVLLPERIDEIGNQAFKNCKKLQGVLIRNKEKITVGNQAFDGCEALRFIASNAKDGEFADGYAPQVTDSKGNGTFFFVPTNANGYGTFALYFNEASDVASYDVVSDGAGGWILYGINKANEPMLALRSGATVADRLVLPKTTQEIFNSAFAETKAESADYFTIDFENTKIKYVDDSAFRYSALGGKILIKANAQINEYAFADCDKIERVQFPGDQGIKIGAAAFQNCTNLTKVKFGQIKDPNGLDAGVFSGCDNLTDIYFANKEPVQLILTGNLPYQFNYEWSKEEESQKLHLHVPEGKELAYLKAWRFGMAGFWDSGDTPAYEDMWYDVFVDNIDWGSWTWPEDEVVDAALKEELLEYENRLRMMLGMDAVTEPVDFYPYHLDDYTGMIRLVGAPSYIIKIDLGDISLFEFLEGWYLDGVETGAFSGTPNLREVQVPETLSEISYDVFKGVRSETLTLKFAGTSPLSLVLEDSGKPFSFGVEDSVLHIEVPKGSEEDYIQAWSYKLAGYEDLSEMRSAVKEELTVDGNTPSDTEVDAAVAKKLLVQVNRLRRMMGLEEIEKLDTAAYGLQTAETEEAKSKDTKKKVDVQKGTDEKENKPSKEQPLKPEENIKPDEETTKVPAQKEEEEKESEQEKTPDSEQTTEANEKETKE